MATHSGKDDTTVATERVRATRSGIPVKPSYGPDDIADLVYETDLGDPGQYPYTRCTYPRGYRDFSWKTRPIFGFGSPEDTRERAAFLSKYGAESHGNPVMNCVPDVPGMYGLDSDDPRARYDVGRGGFSINSIEDMARLLEGTPLDKLDMGIIAHNTAPQFLAMYIAHAEENGVPRAKLRGAQTLDCQTEYVGSCCPVYPVQGSYRVTLDCIQFCAEQMPLWTPVNIQAYNITNLGGNAIQEVAFSLSIALQLLRGGVERGLDLAKLARKLSINYGFHNHFFEEICKLRAARRIWARMLKEKLGVTDPKALALKITIHDSAQSLVAQEPLNNIARIAIHILGSVLGYTQSISATSYDEALCIPTAEAVKTSLMVEEIIREETGVPDVVDPLAGSYYVEWLTTELERRVRACMEDIEAMGGFVAALEDGYPQQQVAAFALEERRQIESGEKVIVGLNKYRPDEPPEVQYFSVDPGVRRVAIERLTELKARRDNASAERSLRGLREAAADPKGAIMPALVEAARARATLGEMTQVLKDCLGDNFSSKVKRLI